MKPHTKIPTKTVNETELFQMLQSESGRRELLALAEALSQQGMADAEDVRALKSLCENTPLQSQINTRHTFNPMDIVKV